jgi:hypothetical protein
MCARQNWYIISQYDRFHSNSLDFRSLSNAHIRSKCDGQFLSPKLWLLYRLVDLKEQFSHVRRHLQTDPSLASITSFISLTSLAKALNGPTKTKKVHRASTLRNLSRHFDNHILVPTLKFNFFLLPLSWRHRCKWWFDRYSKSLKGTPPQLCDVCVSNEP